MHNILQRFDSHDELYLNVVGSDWDTKILESSAVVNSKYADINSVKCYLGPVGSQLQDCESGSDEKSAFFAAQRVLNPGEDFTIVVSVDKDNDLLFPGILGRTAIFITDNWGYAAALIPLMFIGYSWYKKGRDKKYGQLYYGQEETKPVLYLFNRPHTPTIYQPINGLSPAEIGTIVDEYVNIQDVVAEIIELARLGFIKIVKAGKSKSLLSKEDYLLIKTNKQDDITKLRNYQSYLLDKLFLQKHVDESEKKIKKIYKNNSTKLKKYTGLIDKSELITISSLENSFYKYLEEFKKKLYKSVNENGYFDGNPNDVRLRWFLKYGFVVAVTVVVLVRFVSITGNIFPFFVLAAVGVIGFLFASQMPRKSAKGYARYRDILGLKNYLKVGKWRHEIYEKNLFLEEMLPLAISLGVVKKLSSQMAKLKVKPPDYMEGVTAANVGSAINSFSSTASRSLAKSPSSSSSGWSGGSGFSGGAGGGFGGGGGGSW